MTTKKTDSKKTTAKAKDLKPKKIVKGGAGADYLLKIDTIKGEFKNRG